jgi:hypothetical protein
MHTLIITFSLDETAAASFEAMALSSAEPISNVPGLIGKAYLVGGGKTDGTFGGVYFFENRASADAYIDSNIVRSLRANPSVRNLVAEVFGTVDDATRITQRELALVEA